VKKGISGGEIVDMQCIVPILVIKKPHLFRSSTSKQQLRRKAQGSRRKEQNFAFRIADCEFRKYTILFYLLLYDLCLLNSDS